MLPPAQVTAPEVDSARPSEPGRNPAAAPERARRKTSRPALGPRLRGAGLAGSSQGLRAGPASYSQGFESCREWLPDRCALLAANLDALPRHFPARDK